VGKWRQRFVEHGLDGLLDEPRPGAPRKIDDSKVESVIVQTLESQRPDATHWSTRSMARHSGISTSSVGRIWRAFRAAAASP
jgi:transposase